MTKFDTLLLEITKKQMNAIDAKWRKGKQELADTIAKHERGEYEHSAEYINKYGIKRDWLIAYKLTNITPDDDGPNRYNWDAYSKDQKHGNDRVLKDATTEEAKAFAKENGLEVKPSSILF
jgi:hypothetical protein